MTEPPVSKVGTKTKLHVVLASIGTDGDILPFVGLGTRLRERGHAVTLVAGANYRELAENYSLDYRELLSTAETEELLGNPDFWHPFKAAAHAARHGVRLVPRQFDLLRELIKRENTVIVANPAIFAAQIVHEKFGVPLASLILQPWILPSAHVAPVMAGLPFLRWSPRPVRRIFWRLLDAVGDMLVSRHLNPLRSGLGLKPVRRVFSNWLSGQLVLGMFPEWYGARQPDWPPAVRLLGFPIFSGNGGRGLSNELQAFCKSGPAPFAFTFGTGIKHAGALYRAAMEACVSSGERAVFVTKFPEQLPPIVPPGVYVTDYAPFEELFPLCRAVVHHGGIGTIAQALRAGKPQIVLPIAFDQLDNGVRIRKMGAGVYVKSWRATPTSIARAMQVVSRCEFQDCATRIATRFGDESALDLAANAVEKLAGSKLSSGTEEVEEIFTGKTV